jgi:predicted Rossmann-fold nucleotide-binding protein
VRVLVCGGRHYADAAKVAQVLEALGPIDCIIEGGATGADALANRWAKEHGVPCVTFGVDPLLDGPWPAAGPRRNARMLREGRPDLVVAMPGDKGTADMVRRARRAGVKVVLIEIETAD